MKSTTASPEATSPVVSPAQRSLARALSLRLGRRVRPEQLVPLVTAFIDWDGADRLTDHPDDQAILGEGLRALTPRELNIARELFDDTDLMERVARLYFGHLDAGDVGLIEALGSLCAVEGPARIMISRPHGEIDEQTAHAQWRAGLDKQMDRAARLLGRTTATRRTATRPRGAGRPRGRRVVRTARRGGDSGDDSSGSSEPPPDGRLTNGAPA